MEKQFLIIYIKIISIYFITLNQFNSVDELLEITIVKSIFKSPNSLSDLNNDINYILNDVNNLKLK